MHRHSAATATIIGPGDTATEVSVPSSLEIPTNFIVTGTVNVDETTFGFSPKVLDRSMVIEFNGGSPLMVNDCKVKLIYQRRTILSPEISLDVVRLQLACVFFSV